MQKMRQRPGLRPGSRWGSSRRSSRHPSRLGSGHPSPCSTPLSTFASMLAPSACRRRHWSSPLFKVKLRQWNFGGTLNSEGLDNDTLVNSSVVVHCCIFSQTRKHAISEIWERMCTVANLATVPAITTRCCRLECWEQMIIETIYTAFITHVFKLQQCGIDLSNEFAYLCFVRGPNGSKCSLF